jgi:hypothetical protein
MFLERIRDVLKKNEAENNVLVLRRIHVAAELVGGELELASKPMLAELFEFLLDFTRALKARKIAET